MPKLLELAAARTISPRTLGLIRDEGKQESLRIQHLLWPWEGGWQAGCVGGGRGMWGGKQLIPNSPLLAHSWQSPSGSRGKDTCGLALSCQPPEAREPSWQG